MAGQREVGGESTYTLESVNGRFVSLLDRVLRIRVGSGNLLTSYPVGAHESWEAEGRHM